MAVGLLWGWGGSVGLGGVYGAELGLLWGGCGLTMGLGVGPGRILWGWVEFYSSEGRGPLKSMGRPDGHRALVGLGGIYGAEVGLLGGGCGLAGGWGGGQGGFYGAGGNSIVVGVEAH